MQDTAKEEQAHKRRSPVDSFTWTIEMNGEGVREICACGIT